LTPEDYRFWHKMYLLTRTTLPREKVRQLSLSPEVRKNPDLVDDLLPDTLPFFFLEHYAIDLEEALGHDRQATASNTSSSLALTTAH
jgi:hypothetical protein